MTRYLSGLCVAGLGLCGGGWLIVAAVAFGGEDSGGAGKVNLATGAGLIGVSCVSAAAWAVAWRRRMRVDGVLVERFAMVSRREARRNRRELARDVRRTSRLSKRSARSARRGARRSARLAGGPAAGSPVAGDRNLGTPVLGDGSLAGGVVGGQAPGGPGFGGGPSASGTAYNGNVHNGDVPSENSQDRNAPHGAGLGGASAEDVLGELRNLRALLGPLLTATEQLPVSPPLPVRQPQQSWHVPSLPAQAGAAQVGAAHVRAAQAGAAHARAAQAGAAQARAAQPQQAGGLPGGDDELRMLADSEEAWW